MHSIEPAHMPVAYIYMTSYRKLVRRRGAEGMPDDPRPPPGAEKWRTVRSAIEDWGQTARLCVIALTFNVPVDILNWLIKH